jgi:formylmethanofuran dehydrogenase subunit D
MSLFIRPENQNILWDTLHKTSVINSVFPPGSSVEQKNEWFKKHIESKYQKIPRTISKEELYKINREVLSAMVVELRNMFVPITPGGLGESYTRLSNNPTISSEYELREAQYKNLFETPKPKTIDFTEKIDDEAITNMEELIEKHKQSRETDLQLFGAPTAPLSEKRVRFGNETLIQPPTTVSTGMPLEYKDVMKRVDELYVKIENIDTKIEELTTFVRQIFEKTRPNEIKMNETTE